MRKKLKFGVYEIISLFFLVYFIYLTKNVDIIIQNIFIDLGFSSRRIPNKIFFIFTFGILFPAMLPLSVYVKGLLKKNRPSNLIPIYIFVIYVLATFKLLIFLLKIFPNYFPVYHFFVTMFILPLIVMRKKLKFGVYEIILLFYLVYFIYLTKNIDIIIQNIGIDLGFDIPNKYVFIFTYGILFPAMLPLSVYVKGLFKKSRPSNLIPIYIFVIYVLATITLLIFLLKIFPHYHLYYYFFVTMFILPLIFMPYSIKYYLKHKLNHWKLYLPGIIMLYSSILFLFYWLDTLLLILMY